MYMYVWCFMKRRYCMLEVLYAVAHSDGVDAICHRNFCCKIKFNGKNCVFVYNNIFTQKLLIYTKIADYCISFSWVLPRAFIQGHPQIRARPLIFLFQWERIGEDPWHESILGLSSYRCIIFDVYLVYHLQELRRCPTAPPTCRVHLCTARLHLVTHCIFDMFDLRHANNYLWAYWSA